MQSSDSFHGFGYTFWNFWILALHLLYKLWILHILATSITEETCIVEMRIWCRKIGTVNVITLKSALYLELHLEIDNKGQLRTKTTKRGFQLPSYQISPLYGYIPVAHVYGVYVFLFIHHCRACMFYHDVYHRVDATPCC